MDKNCNLKYKIISGKVGLGSKLLLAALIDHTQTRFSKIVWDYSD